jgi:hypothetical protein
MAKRSYSCEQPNPNEGEDIIRLELSDDRRFVYSWEWCTYAWHVIKEAEGRWEQRGDVLTLHVEKSELYGLTPPATLKAVQRGDTYDFGNATVVVLVPPPDDPYQRREAELEEQKLKQSMNVKPSKLVK